MTNLFRVRTSLTGFPGADGVSTMYFLDIVTAMDSISSMWNTWANFMPNDVHIQTHGTGDIIDDATGNLTGAFGVADPAGHVGGDLANYAAPVGGCVNWHTSTVLDTHRVRGRTFVVPMTGLYFTTNGQINGATAAAIQEAAAAFITAQSTSFVVWHRPYPGRPAVGTKPARPAHAGGHALVTGASVSTKAAILRSRRD